MVTATIDKDALKKAIVEVLSENRDVFKEVIVELYADLAMAAAIEEGLTSLVVSRDEVFQVLGSGREGGLPKKVPPRSKTRQGTAASRRHSKAHRTR